MSEPMKNNPPVPKRGGARPGAGRPKGVPNRTTTAIKDMIIKALDTAGGEKYLAEQADKNPAAFLTLVGKVLPMQLTGDPENPVAVSHDTPEGWEKRLSEAALRELAGLK